MKMKNIPEIKIIKDDLQKREFEVFSRFLNNPKFPQLRNNILRAFPDLKEESLEDFIADFYEDNREKIDLIIKESGDLIKQKSIVALQELSNLMNYEWRAKTIYEAIPTILSFSPFKDNSFNFSILGQINGRKDKNVLFIAIHEISHFVLFDILEKEKINLEDDLRHYFKETLTAVLLNERPLADILDLKDYSGNPEIRDIKIKKTDGNIASFFDFLKEYHQKSKNFNEFLELITKILVPVSDEFSKKRKFWNSYGNKIFSDKNLLDEYKIPIKTKGG